MTRLAIITGQGQLPSAMAQAWTAAQDVAPVICAPEGLHPEGVTVDRAFRLERLSPFLRTLADDGITHVALAGAMHRPALDPAMFDPATVSFLPRVLPALQQGDDALLRALIGVIEDHDLSVVGVADVAPALLADEGALTDRAPKAAETADAARGLAILQALGAVDVGQGCVVASGLCLAVESLYGTDAMLEFTALNRPSRRPEKGGILVKRAKPGQDLRVDLPAIGPHTVAAAQRAGLTGIAIEAGAVVILSRAAVLAQADAAGIAMWAMA
ncbi:MAG: LpxI family protein [Pararhodobacter sp.]